MRTDFLDVLLKIPLRNSLLDPSNSSKCCKSIMVQIPFHKACLSLLRLGESRLEVGAESLAELRERDAVRVQVELLLELIELLGRL